MDGFAIISRDRYLQGTEKRSFLQHIMPPKVIRGNIGNISYTNISVPDKFQAHKLHKAVRKAYKISSVVVSRDYNINYSFMCYYSLLIRALDYYSISLGCDIRLSEVVIGDGATYEGICAFQLLCPIAKRIVLVNTGSREKLMGITEKAMMKYGMSAAVVENPIKAAERADVVVLASDSPEYGQLLTRDRPTLIIRYPKLPMSGRWFDGAGISFMGGEKINEAAVQGYLSYMKKELQWQMAEKEGFTLDTITQQGKVILSR